MIGIFDGKRFFVAVFICIDGIIARHADDFIDRVVFERLIENQVHVVRRDVMVLCIQSVRVYKMAVGCTDRLCLFVHHIRKALYGTADMLCNCNGRIIGGFDQKCMERLV